MKASQFERAKELYATVKALDSDIKEIERVAGIIANGENEIKFNLKVRDLTPPKDRVTIDEIGDLKYNSKHAESMRFMGLFSFGDVAKKTKPEYVVDFKHKIPDSLALELLGVLLQSKLQARDKAIRDLGKLGVTI